MTWREIQAAYPDQWVVLGEHDSAEVTLELHSAVVRGHGASHREASLNARIDDAEPGPFAHLFTGVRRSPRSW